MADATRNFLEVLVDPVDADVDFVAIHGLNPIKTGTNAYSTWTASNDKRWLDNPDFLPKHFPKARVMVFGYNSNPAFASSNAGLNEQAQNLLFNLRLRRSDCPNRSLVFICHSLGGLLAKRALVMAWNTGPVDRPTYDATLGIVFFGTPHGGGNKVSVGRIAASIARFVFNRPENSFLRDLEKNDFFAEANRADFIERAKDFQYISFYESINLKGVAIIVDRQNAILGLPNEQEQKVAMDADHSQICTFPDENSQPFFQVWKSMELMIESAAERRAHSPNELFVFPFDEDEHFCGRELLLDDIHNSLNKRQGSKPGQCRCVLVGMGGIGKSSLAISYALRFRHEYNGLFFASAESKESIVRDFHDIDLETTRKTKMNFRQWTGNKKKTWLLIVDNYDDPSVFLPARYIPPSLNGHIIFTTRRIDVASIGEAIEVPSLSLNKATELLLNLSEDRKRTDRDWQLAESLVQLLNLVPLAISQCGPLLNDGQSSLEDYPQEFNDLMNKIAPSGEALEDGDSFSWSRSKSILTTWEVSFKRLLDTDPSVAHLYSVLGVIDASNIAEQVIVNGIKKHRRWSLEGNAVFAHLSPVPVFVASLNASERSAGIEVALKKLQNYSLLSRRANDGSYYIHPLIRYWLAFRADRAYQMNSFESAIFILANGFPDPDFSPRYGQLEVLYRRIVEYERHILSILKAREKLSQLQHGQLQHAHLLLLGRLLLHNARVKNDFSLHSPGVEGLVLPPGFIPQVEWILEKTANVQLWFDAMWTFFTEHKQRCAEEGRDIFTAVLSGQYRFAGWSWPRNLATLTQQEVNSMESLGCNPESTLVDALVYNPPLKQRLMPISPRTGHKVVSGLMGQFCLELVKSWQKDQNQPRAHSRETFVSNEGLTGTSILTDWCNECPDFSSGFETLVKVSMVDMLCDQWSKPLMEPTSSEDLKVEFLMLFANFMQGFKYVTTKTLQTLGSDTQKGTALVLRRLWGLKRINTGTEVSRLEDDMINKTCLTLLQDDTSESNFYAKVKTIDFWQGWLCYTEQKDRLVTLLETWLAKFKDFVEHSPRATNYANDPVLDMYEYLIVCHRDWYPNQELADLYIEGYSQYARKHYNRLMFKLCLGCGVGAAGTSFARLRLYEIETPPDHKDEIDTDESEGSWYWTIDRELKRRHKEPDPNWTRFEEQTSCRQTWEETWRFIRGRKDVKSRPKRYISLTGDPFFRWSPYASDYAATGTGNKYGRVDSEDSSAVKHSYNKGDERSRSVPASTRIHRHSRSSYLDSIQAPGIRLPHRERSKSCSK